MVAKDEARLDQLLKKRRSELKEGLVQAVLTQDISVQDKILRIGLIDAITEPRQGVGASKPRGPLVRPPRKPGAPQPTPPPPTEQTLGEVARVARLRESLGKPPARGRLWAYLTRDYNTIEGFGLATHTLTRGLWPLTLNPSPSARVFLTQTLKTQIAPVLLQALPRVVKKSWLHLLRPQYNHLAALEALAGEVQAWELPSDLKELRTPPAVSDKLVGLLALFHTSPGLMGQVLQAWELVAHGLALDERVRQAGVAAIQGLLDSEGDRVSLSDLVLALLMVKARRSLNWADLIPPGSGWFAQDSFDCPPAVQNDIDRAIAGLVARLEALDAEFLEIRRIRYFVPEGNLLEEFVHGQDSSDPYKWCKGFLKILGETMGPLLAGRVTFAGGGMVQLFNNPTLSSSIARLEALRVEMGTGTPNPELLASATRVVMNLGRILVVLIRNQSKTADLLARASENSAPTEPIPYEEDRLARPEEWRGETVIEALVRSARICLLAGRFLGDTSLESKLEKQGGVAEVAGDLLERVGRYASPGFAASQRTLYAHLLES